jgi:hypothetical protein
MKYKDEMGWARKTTSTYRQYWCPAHDKTSFTRKKSLYTLPSPSDCAEGFVVSTYYNPVSEDRQQNVRALTSRQGSDARGGRNIEFLRSTQR